MRKELQQLDQELKSANDALILRRDFQMYGHNFTVEANAFIREVERVARKEKRNIVLMQCFIIL